MVPRVYDLSHKLNANIYVYPGDLAFSSSHVASHFFDDGKKIDELDLSTLIGPAYVVDVRGKKARHRITWDDLKPFETQIKNHRIIFIQTGWSEHWGLPAYIDHPFLDGKAAEMLIVYGVNVIGVDAFSPDETKADGSMGDFSAHKVILGSGAVIVENLTGLDKLPSNSVEVILLPLNVEGCDASPVRAVGRERT
ncbi:putative cyclase [Rickenella mellea]|uniref:Putative cyclase n=1 Tax=Rickenella mellea TaxID=50990 RepID=A0A4Y7PU30_9AGAM|nr:putative cyclase [Rickenella mellea]